MAIHQMAYENSIYSITIQDDVHESNPNPSRNCVVRRHEATLSAKLQIRNGLYVANPAHTMNTASLCCLLTLLLAMPAAAAEGDGISWSIISYVWASDTKVDLKADGTPIGGDTVSFNDLIDITDTSFQIFVEGGRSDGNWSAFVDVTYIETSDKFSAGPVLIKTNSEQWYIDAAIAYWPNGEAGGFNLFGGMRFTSLDDRFKFSLPALGMPLGTLKNDRSFTDLLLGARYRFDFNESWALHTRADYAFGDSEGILQVEALVRYAIGKNRKYAVLIGYRYKEAEFEDGGLEEDFEFKGPIAGFNFRF